MGGMVKIYRILIQMITIFINNHIQNLHFLPKLFISFKITPNCLLFFSAVHHPIKLYCYLSCVFGIYKKKPSRQHYCLKRNNQRLNFFAENTYAQYESAFHMF